MNHPETPVHVYLYNFACEYTCIRESNAREIQKTYNKGDSSFFCL